MLQVASCRAVLNEAAISPFAHSERRPARPGTTATFLTFSCCGSTSEDFHQTLHFPPFAPPAAVNRTSTSEARPVAKGRIEISKRAQNHQNAS
jgi:hypothetical protein